MEGFSVVEAVVAITLLAAVFVLLAGLFSAMLINTVFARQNQQAIDIISEQIERIRSEVYEDTALRPTDIGSDCKIVLVGTVHHFDPDCGGPAAPTEPIVLSATGTVSPYVSTVVRNNVRFTVSRYVTAVPDVLGAASKRVTVHAQWTENGRRRQREAATIVTLNRRGLPLPKFSYRTAVTKTVNQGATLVLPGRIVNNGARDRFNLTAAAGGRTWSFRFYEDVNGNGQKDPADTTELFDTDGDGTRDTGLLETDAFKNFLVVHTVAPTELLGPVAVTRRATSAVGATASTGVATVTDTIVVATQLCSGCTLVTSYLRSAGPPGADTVATNGVPMDALASTHVGGLPNYDTDKNDDPGRTIVKGPLSPCGAGCPPGSTETDVAKVASWTFAAPNVMTITGDLSLNLWLAMEGKDATKNLSLVVHVLSQQDDLTGAYVVQRSKTFTASPLGFADFAPVEVRVPVNFVIGQNRNIEVRVLADTGSGANVWLAYDTAAHPSHVVLPVASGA